MIRWIKTISILATAVLLSFTLACDSKNNPSSPSMVPAPASVPGPSSFSTANVSAVREFGEFEEGDDDVSADDEGEDSCARSPGFYCQNQNGKNPNMSAEEFQLFAAEAALLLSTVEELDTPEEVAAAVCDTSDQLFRHLTTLALNLASGRISATDDHANPDFPTVGDAFAHAVAVADGSIEVTTEERKEVKRMLEQISENVSINEGEECQVDEDDDEDVSDGDSGSAPACNSFDPTKPGKILVCHKDRKTLSISSNAWPAHWGHGDTCGTCSGS